MLVKPIPKHLLIHTVQYHEIILGGRYGTEYKDPVTLENVLVQFGTVVKRTNTAGNRDETKEAKAVLFIDVTHSTPFIIPVEKSKINLNGQEFTINLVDHLFTTQLHHLEVELI